MLTFFGVIFIRCLWFAAEFRLTSPLTQITSDSQVFHEQGFLHRGPVYGVGNGTYLVNGTEIFLITDSNPPALQQITGKHASTEL